MKKILLLLIFMVIGCKDKEPEKVIAKEPVKVVDPYSYTDFILSTDTEKLMLLSILKKIPQDTLRLVLREYLKANPDDLDGLGMNKADNLDTISQKYHISKFKIASIIFSYKYEMLTKEDIEESAIESYLDDNQE